MFHPKQVWVTLRVRVGVKEGGGRGEYFSTWGYAAEQKRAAAPPSVHSVPRYEEEGGKLVLTSLASSPVLCYSGFCISRPSNTPQAAPVTGSGRSCLGASLHRQGLFCVAPARREGHLRICFWRPSRPRSSGSEPEAG